MKAVCLKATVPPPPANRGRDSKAASSMRMSTPQKAIINEVLGDRRWLLEAMIPRMMWQRDPGHQGTSTPMLQEKSAGRFVEPLRDAVHIGFRVEPMEGDAQIGFPHGREDAPVITRP